MYSCENTDKKLTILKQKNSVSRNNYFTLSLRLTKLMIVRYVCLSTRVKALRDRSELDKI